MAQLVLQLADGGGRDGSAAVIAALALEARFAAG
jgi:hypothetical protein